MGWLFAALFQVFCTKLPTASVGKQKPKAHPPRAAKHSFLPLSKKPLPIPLACVQASRASLQGQPAGACVFLCAGVIGKGNAGGPLAAGL